MKITFWGAAKQVTGSMHLLTLDNGYKILVDCGLNYEQKKLMTKDTFSFPFNPIDIDLVLLTHAHIDHSGNLPALVNQGFTGKILCTAATADLAKFLLFDSANIQWQEYKQKLGKAGKSRKRNFVSKPIYTEKDVQQTLEKLVTIDFAKRLDISSTTSIEFIEAGHLLGAASIVVETKNDNNTKRIGFTGDLGRNHAELIRIPIAMKNLNYLVTETTYGARNHKSSQDSETELLKYIEETCVRVRGRLIIPAFSVGRTQTIVHTINKLEKKGLLPSIKVFVDSPLAVKSANTYTYHHNLLNNEAKQFLKEHGNLFDFDNLFWINNLDEHDKLMEYKDPCIIVSAAGMVESGRIQEHVKNNIQNPFSTILIAGYCSEGTLGYKLLQGQKIIEIKGKNYPIYSKIAYTDTFSSHPDKDELYAYIRSCENNLLQKIFLVHGDERNLIAMKQTLENCRFKVDIQIPETGNEFKI